MISVLLKHNALQINTFIFSKNIHNPEVPGSNPGLATVDIDSSTLASFCLLLQAKKVEIINAMQSSFSFEYILFEIRYRYLLDTKKFYLDGEVQIK